jgi:glutathione S-transferase
MALYEMGISFELKMIDGSEPVASEFAALWPIQRFPVIVDDGQFVFEATGIIEIDEAFLREVGAKVRPGDIRYREDIVDGIEKAPEAFIGMLAGRNFGKAIVRPS